MVSKLATISLALAAVASAQADCGLSDNGVTIVNAIDTLMTDNDNLLAAINSWSMDESTDQISQKMTTVTNDATTLASDFGVIRWNDCDVTTVVTLLGEAASTIIDIVSTLENERNIFAMAGLTTTSQGFVSTLASSTTQVINAAFNWLPCDAIDQVFDTVDYIFGNITAAQHAYDVSPSVLPSKPTNCATTATGGSTPTSPPTCSKKRVKRAN
ncbi:hypothetical protein TRVA0_068S00430 [Trichomonascus vanleenenianus]|uniref:uncharacterized protein n=1 Tax=Trichomonascus vanleenenianus TaxID=2268995 RepID=UPI003EC9FF4E